MDGAGSRHGKARVTEIPEGGSAPPDPPGGKARVTEIPGGASPPPDPPTITFQKKRRLRRRRSSTQRSAEKFFDQPFFSRNFFFKFSAEIVFRPKKTILPKCFWAETNFGRKHFSDENFAARIAEGGSNGGRFGRPPRSVCPSKFPSVHPQFGQ